MRIKRLILAMLFACLMALFFAPSAKAQEVQIQEFVGVIATSFEDAEDGSSYSGGEFGGSNIDHSFLFAGACGVTLGATASQDRTHIIENHNSWNDIYPGFTKRIVSCIQYIIFATANEYMQNFTAVFDIYATGIIAIAIIIFGIKVAFGGLRSTRADFMVLVFMVLFVSYAVRSGGIEDYLHVFINIQESLMDTVTETLKYSGYSVDETGGETRIIEKGVCAKYFDVWQRIDCILGHFMGADPAFFAENGQLDYAVDLFNAYDPRNVPGSQVADASDKIASGLISLAPFQIALGAMDTPFGPLLLILVVVSTFLFIAAIGQAIVVYIGSMLVVLFLAIIGHIIVPLVLFPATKNIFSYWFQMVVSYTLQPAILMAYLVLMVHVLDITFDPKTAQIADDEGIVSLVDIYAQFQQGVDDDGNVRDSVDETEKRVRLTKQLSELISASVSTTGEESATEDEDQTTETNVEGGTRSAIQFKTIKLFGHEYSSEQIAEFLTTGNADALEERSDRRMWNFFYSMMVLTLVLLITFTFMRNVLAFGAELAGAITAPVDGGLTLYNRALSAMTKVGQR